MAGLTGRRPLDTFPELLKLTQARDGDGFILVEDGLGNPTPLRLSSNGVEIAGVGYPVGAPNSNGKVLSTTSSGTGSWVYGVPGFESYQKPNIAGGVVNLVEPHTASNYSIDISGSTTVNLPSMASYDSNALVSITVKVKQLTTTASIQWVGAGGENIVFDSRYNSLAGVGKITIFSFIYYKGEGQWLGNVIWSQ